MAKKTEQGLRCSFCGRLESEVELLMPGMNGCICNECAERADQLAKEYLDMGLYKWLLDFMPDLAAVRLEEAQNKLIEAKTIISYRSVPPRIEGFIQAMLRSALRLCGDRLYGAVR